MSHRLNETSYLLLTALAEGESHGYALAQRVAEITDGDVRPGAGTLYSTLERLLANGYIVESGTEIVDGRARRSYRIRSSGTDAVAMWATQLQRRVAAVNAALGAI
ncbi:MAG: PadR family transcriptional regulator [Aquihabitans sp.]